MRYLQKGKRKQPTKSHNFEQDISLCRASIISFEPDLTLRTTLNSQYCLKFPGVINGPWLLEQR